MYFFVLNLANWQLYLTNNEKNKLKDSIPQMKGINGASSQAGL